MIAYLEGTVMKIKKDGIILFCPPIGFEVSVLNPGALSKGQKLCLYTYQQFREDGQSLYGFEQEEQLELFELLIGVKGLGCKTVMSAMNQASAQTIIQAIERADAAALKKLPGIGAKTAGQIILDLKGKIVVPVTAADGAKKEQPQASAAWQEVSMALESLGYKPAQIEQIRANLADSMDLSTDELLRLALRSISQRNRLNAL